MDEALFRSLLKDSYTFQPTPSDWDTGRTGTVLLARNQDENDVVIKWTDSDNPDYERDKQRIKTEARILNLLNENQGGSWRVPKVSDSNEVRAYGGTYRATYLAMSLVTGLRVEKNLHLLDEAECREIARQFLDVISTAHDLGITNRDIDIKHLFWDRQGKNLTVIDWGNGRQPGDNIPRDFTRDVYYTLELLQALVPNDEFLRRDQVLVDMYAWKTATKNIDDLDESSTSPHKMEEIAQAFSFTDKKDDSGPQESIAEEEGQPTTPIQEPGSDNTNAISDHGGKDNTLPPSDDNPSFGSNFLSVMKRIVPIVRILLLLLLLIGTSFFSWQLGHQSVTTPQPGSNPSPDLPTPIPEEIVTPTPPTLAPGVTVMVVTAQPTATPTFAPLPDKAQAGFRTLFDLYKQTQLDRLPLLGPGGTPLPSEQESGLDQVCPEKQPCVWRFTNFSAAQMTLLPGGELRADLGEYYHPQGVLSTARHISLMGQFSNFQKDQLGEIGLFFGDASQRVELVFRFDAEKKLGMAYKINGQATPITTSTDPQTQEQTKIELLTDRPFWLYIQFSGEQVQVFLKEDTMDVLGTLPLENLPKIADFSLPQPIQSVQEIGFIGRGGPIAVLDVLHFKLYP